MLGFLFPIIGLLSFIIPIFVCKTQEPFEHNIDDAFDDYEPAANSSAVAPSQVELPESDRKEIVKAEEPTDSAAPAEAAADAEGQ